MVILATKVYVDGQARNRAFRGLEAMVNDLLTDLDVEYEIGVRHDGFPTVTIHGPDATAARNLLADQWGTLTPEHESGSEYVGTLESWDADGFTLDAGETVRIPTDEIKLGTGTPEQIRQRFGLVQHVPLRYIADDPPRLADSERDRLFDWRRGNGRVNINSATRSEVRATVNRSGHADDVITVERLGLLEQSVICAPGTDPPGIVSAIGPHLPAELLAVIT